MRNLIKHIKPLTGASKGSSVELVAIKGKNYILKTTTAQDVAVQNYFTEILAKNKIPILNIIKSDLLNTNQLLYEYLDGSPTLSRNLSVENVRQWGNQIGKMHNITYNEIFRLDGDGKNVTEDWFTFLKGYIEGAVTYQTSRQTDITPAMLEKSKTLFNILFDYHPSTYSLIHGDLHRANALIKNGQVVLFDKDRLLMTAPPIFDIVLIFAESFPGGYYTPLDKEYPDDPKYLNAFFEGYGPFEYDQKLIDAFALLRSLHRYPNPFFKRLRKVIFTILERY